MFRSIAISTSHRAARLAPALLLIGGLLVMLFCFSPTDNWAWDPSFYYAQIRSPVIEHNLDFRDETNTSGVDTGLTETGLQNSPWPVGPGLFWSPFFLLAHALTRTFAPALADGFSFPYVALVSAGSIFYGLAGVYLVYRLCRRFAPEGLSALAALAALGASPLFYYTFHQPLMAHTTGLLTTAAMLLLYLELSEGGPGRVHPASGFLFGVALGLCFLVRWNGILMAAAPAFYLIERLVYAWRHDRGQLKPVALQAVILVAAFALAIAPQMALWYRLHGRLIVAPQDGGSFVGGLLPLNAWKVVFASTRGLVWWFPFAIVGTLGLFLLRDRRVKWMGLILVAAMVGLVGYRVDWFRGGGYGARYFIELLPFFALGFASLGNRLSQYRWGRWALALAGAGMVAHQLVLMWGVTYGAVGGWIDLKAYFEGLRLGFRWQARALVGLLTQPQILLSPVPSVAQDRQSIVVNLLAGVTDWRAYAITGPALLIAPALVGLGLWLRRAIRRERLLPLYAAALAYLLAWAVVYLAVG